MISEFLVALFLTLIITRISAHLFHDRKNYRTRKERSRTITGYLRKKTGLDWHHIHIGVILILISFLLFFLNGVSVYAIIILAIGLSLFCDQILPLLNLGDYFSKKMLVYSIVLHIIVALITIILFKFS